MAYKIKSKGRPKAEYKVRHISKLRGLKHFKVHKIKGDKIILVKK
jgi:hypothetical protein